MHCFLHCASTFILWLAITSHLLFVLELYPCTSTPIHFRLLLCPAFVLSDLFHFGLYNIIEIKLNANVKNGNELVCYFLLPKLGRAISIEILFQIFCFGRT